MNTTRAVSHYDLDILKDLQSEWGDKIKIDRDITGNPCLFIKYKGPWDVLYVLSIDGLYNHNKWHYVLAAHKAAINYCRKKEEEIINAEQEQRYAEGFHRLREKIQTEGYKDDLPEE